jgi:non-specific serine/threonine protein kinase
MPLAIELAAARIKILSVGELAARLEDSFQLLTGGSRTALPRQQTLKATLDWSHDLLAPAEQVFFRRLAVFAGTFTLQTVEQVAGGVSGSGAEIKIEHVSTARVLDLLTGLVDQSLVMVTGDAAGYRRYQLLEPIRQYARMQLEASGETSSLQERHAQCFLAFAEAVEPHLEASDQAMWLEQLAQDHDNLRAALAWFSVCRDSLAGLRLASALRLYWFARGEVREGREHLTTFLALSQGDTNQMRASVERAKALDSAGFLARYQGDYRAAEGFIRESLAIRKALGDRWGEADALANLGFVILHRGDFTQAQALYQESLEISRTLANEQGIADALSHLGLAAFYQGDYATAQTMHEQTRAIWEGLGDRQGVAWALHCLGRAVLEQGDIALAGAKFAESVTIAQDLGLRWGIAWSLEDHARLAARMGLSPEVLRLLGCSSALRRRIGIPLLPQERVELDTLVEAAREALGLDAGAAAWSEGETMPVEQAMDALLR